MHDQRPGSFFPDQPSTERQPNLMLAVSLEESVMAMLDIRRRAKILESGGDAETTQELIVAGPYVLLPTENILFTPYRKLRAVELPSHQTQVAQIVMSNKERLVPFEELIGLIGHSETIGIIQANYYNMRRNSGDPLVPSTDPDFKKQLHVHKHFRLVPGQGLFFKT